MVVYSLAEEEEMLPLGELEGGRTTVAALLGVVPAEAEDCS